MIMNTPTQNKNVCTHLDSCIICGGPVERIIDPEGLKARLETITGAKVLEIIVRYCQRCSTEEYERTMRQNAN